MLILFQAFQAIIEIFQQKNESFKNALKDMDEVSVSVGSNCTELNYPHMSVLPQ